MRVDTDSLTRSCSGPRRVSRFSLSPPPLSHGVSPRILLRRVAALSILALMSACVAPSASVRLQHVEEPQPIPADLLEQVGRAERMGFELHIFDKATWIATDVFQEHVGSLQAAHIGGYLPLREGDDEGRAKDSFLVWFFSKDDPTKLAYRVRVFARPGRQSEFEAFTPPVPAPPELALLMQAREAALKAVPELIQPLNPIVFPGEVDGEPGILVYLLAGTTKPNVVVLGRHYRVLLQEDGATIRHVHPLSKSVLEMPVTPPGGAKPVGLWVTHLVTEYPLETHVFASLLHKLPIYVGTSRGNWRVDGNTINFLGERSDTESTR